MSTQLDYGQVGSAIAKLRGDETVLGRTEVDQTTASLLEALLALHNDTAIALEEFPEVDALARLIAPTDFDCCAGGTPAHVEPGMCPDGCGLPVEHARALDVHMGRKAAS